MKLNDLLIRIISLTLHTKSKYASALNRRIAFIAICNCQNDPINHTDWQSEIFCEL